MRTKRRDVTSGIAALLAAVLVWVPVALAASDGMVGPGPEFARIDRNHDGYISRDEAKVLKDFSKSFNEADDNRDGKLDPDEFVKAQAIRDRILAGQFIEDSVITAKVKAALLKDPSVSGLDVRVETYRGTVLLSGFVEDVKQVRRAAEIASQVRGVTAVRNSLLVKRLRPTNAGARS